MSKVKTQMRKLVLSGKTFVDLEGNSIVMAQEQCQMCKQPLGDGEPIFIGKHIGNSLTRAAAKAEDAVLWYTTGAKAYKCDDSVYTDEEIGIIETFYKENQDLSVIICAQVQMVINEAEPVEMEEAPKENP